MQAYDKLNSGAYYFGNPKSNANRRCILRGSSYSEPWTMTRNASNNYVSFLSTSFSLLFHFSEIGFFFVVACAP